MESQKIRLILFFALAVTALVLGFFVMRALIPQSPNDTPVSNDSGKQELLRLSVDETLSFEIDRLKWVVERLDSNGLIRLRNTNNEAEFSVISYGRANPNEMNNLILNEVKSLDKFAKSFELESAGNVEIGNLTFQKIEYLFSGKGTETTEKNIKHVLLNNDNVYKFMLNVNTEVQFPEEEITQILNSIQITEEQN